MAEYYLGGGRRRRGASSDGLLLLFGVVVFSSGALWRFAPRGDDGWQTAAGLIGKKLPSIILYAPAWRRDILHELDHAPVVMLNHGEHLTLAGLGRVVYASDDVPAAAALGNWTSLMELRDFGGKAVEVLRVADRSLVRDFSELSVIIDDPPGIANCPKTADGYHCDNGDVTLSRENFSGNLTDCLRVHGGETLSIVWAAGQDAKLRYGEIFLGVPDGGASANTLLEARVDGRLGARLKPAQPGAWVHAPLPVGDARRVELTVRAEKPVCVDVEVAQ